MMVLTASRAAGHGLPSRSRATKDADIVVDVCAESRGLALAAHELRQLGFDTIGSASDDARLARCTFTHDVAQIDVLCPDDAEADALDAVNGVRSLAIPGGRRALETAEPVRITYDDDALDAEVPVPLLPWALVVKAHAAVDPRTSDQARHIQDLGELAAVIDDPLGAARLLSDADVAVLTVAVDQIEARPDVASQTLEGLSRARSRAALQILTGR